MDKEILCIRALMTKDVYFIFRTDSSEVKVDIRNGHPVSKTKLTQIEISYFYQNVI